VIYDGNLYDYCCSDCERTDSSPLTIFPTTIGEESITMLKDRVEDHLQELHAELVRALDALHPEVEKPVEPAKTTDEKLAELRKKFADQ